jgi:hypothetical protein
MGASVVAYWPNITGEDLESQPGFYNGPDAWAGWAVARASDAKLLQRLKNLGLGAISTFATSGVEDSDIEWVNPNELEAAALRLRTLVLERSPDVEDVVSSYSVSATAPSTARDDLAQDLADIAALAGFAKAQGAHVMTLQINW